MNDLHWAKSCVRGDLVLDVFGITERVSYVERNGPQVDFRPFHEIFQHRGEAELTVACLYSSSPLPRRFRCVACRRNMAQRKSTALL